MPDAGLILRTVDSVDTRADWDDLAAGVSFYLSRDWLRPSERSSSATARYLVVTGPGGDLVAASPYYLVSRERNDFYRLDLLGLQPQPTGRYVCAGSRRGYHNAPLVRDTADAAIRRHALRLMSDEICAVADQAGQGTAWWLYVADETVGELCAAADCDVPLYLDMEARAQLRGWSWDDFLDGLPSARRRTLRREDRAFARAPYSVSVASLRDCWYEAGPLLANVQRRYGHSDSPEEARDYLAGLALGSADPGSVILCRREGALVGYCHFYDFGRTRWLRSVGFDYPRLAGAYEYFALTYYLPIREAYARGLRSAHYGIKSLGTKALRGATLRPLWAVPIGEAAAGWPSWRRRERNRNALAAARAQLGPAFASLDQAAWTSYI
jgi:uncharacterized protein